MAVEGAAVVTAVLATVAKAVWMVMAIMRWKIVVSWKTMSMAMVRWQVMAMVRRQVMAMGRWKVMAMVGRGLMTML